MDAAHKIQSSSSFIVPIINDEYSTLKEIVECTQDRTRPSSQKIDAPSRKHSVRARCHWLSQIVGKETEKQATNWGKLTYNLKLSRVLGETGMAVKHIGFLFFDHEVAPSQEISFVYTKNSRNFVTKL